MKPPEFKGVANSLEERASLANNSREPQTQSILDDYLAAAADETSAAGRSTPLAYWWIFLSLGMANSSDASEILCLSYILAQPKFMEMGSTLASVLAAAVFGGMLLGGLIVGALGDCWGRKSTLSYGLGITAFCGLLSSLTPNTVVLTVLRFGSGLGIGATVPPLFALTSELAPRQHRGYWVTVVAAHWMVGSIMVALMGWWILSVDHPHNWRWFLAVCALPSAIGLFLVSGNVPESPRFLAINGQAEEAARVAHGLAQKLGSYDRPLEASAISACYPPAHSPSIHGVNSCTFFVRNFIVQSRKVYVPEQAAKTWPLQALWFALSFGSYGLMTWINTLFVQVHLENIYGNALLFSLANLPGNAMSALLMDVMGRAKLLVISMVCSAASLIVFAYVAADTDSDTQLPKYWIVGAACGFQCFTIVAWNSIDVISSEMFPTDIRSTGLGLCTASGRIGAMIAQVVNGHLVDRPARLLTVAAVTLLFGACAPGLLPSDLTGQAMSDTNVTSVEEARNAHDRYSDHLPPKEGTIDSELAVMGSSSPIV